MTKFNIDGNFETCPICGYNYVHIDHIVQNDNLSSSNQGNVSIYFEGECGHSWIKIYSEHKGQVSRGLILHRMQLVQNGTVQEDTQFSDYLKYEFEVRELFDYTLPVKDWCEFTANEIYKLIDPNFTTGDARLVGRVLTKFVNENPLITKRKINGYWKYTVPIVKEK